MHSPWKYLMLLFFGTTLLGCHQRQNVPQSASVSSPDGQISMQFSLSVEGVPQYAIKRSGKTILKKSNLGFQLKNNQNLDKNFRLVSIDSSETNTTWKQPWGQTEQISDHHKELMLKLQQNDEKKQAMVLRFRVFNDGVGFRYEVPKQKDLDSLVITNELTQFALNGDLTAWWIPADYDSYEYVYHKTKLSEINVNKASYKERGDRHVRNKHGVNTPVTLKTNDSLYLSIHEADLTDYAGMTLGMNGNNTFDAELVPWKNGDKVRTQAPFVSPWRTIMIDKKAKGLLTNHLILNLNDPNKLGDVSDWAIPMKYTGIWWEMQLGKSTWKRRDENGKLVKNHGATTENAEKYIQFNKKHHMKGMLVEGWNTGWEYWGAQDTLGFFDFVTPYPDYDLKKVVHDAKANGVELIMHNETSGDARNYAQHLEKAFQLYHDLGIHTIKTGYAGTIVPKGEYHHGQYMVRHYQKVIETAAKYQIAIDAHEPIKATGKRRTYPNFMSREGVRGMEYNAWAEENPASHTTILPFTRILGGPVDYTPGIFALNLEKYRKGQALNSTLVNQLALYVVLYGPLQMAADLPENYRKHEDAFQFIKDVPVDWKQTEILNASIGNYVTIARQDKHSDNWFVGGVTNEKARTLKIPFDFLEKGATYKATIYKDAENADFKTNPTAYKIETMQVNSGTVYTAKMASGGGVAITLVKE